CRQAQDGGERLKRDEISLNRHRALDSCLGMIFSENRFALFRIMLQRPWNTAARRSTNDLMPSAASDVL
ncbi:hypothetical protein, partial [Borreliella burgdorferi]|uniref:hypothetical protein n=1 Tax=Borreliella burgdorferi TaxID=139 RepID=UPI001AEFF0C1